MAWSGIFSRAGSIRDAATACSISPPARAIFRASWWTGRARGTLRLRIDAVDANPGDPRNRPARKPRLSEIEFLKANVLTYGSRESYDLVCCSLALHHFSEDDAVTLLGRCHALSHRFVLVADLERSFSRWLGVQALTALFYRAPMTRADAVTSARRAFSFDEFRALAEAAGWKDFGHARFLFCRQALWMEGRDAGDIPVAVETVDDGLPCPTSSPARARTCLSCCRRSRPAGHRR
jgi:SAM-dependent methyltransferase